MFGETVKVTCGKCKFQVLRKFNFLAEVHSQFIKQRSPVEDLQIINVVYNRARVLKNNGQPILFPKYGNSKQKPFVHKTKLLLYIPRTKKNFVSSSLVARRFVNNLGADQHSMSCTVAKTNRLIHVDALLLDMTCEVIYETLSTARFNRVSSDFSENI